MEMFVCRLTRDFMSGINLLQRRDFTIKEPLDFTVIAVTEKGYKNRVECTLAKKYVIILEKLQ